MSKVLIAATTLTLSVAATLPSHAASAKCEQARSMVGEVESRLAQGPIPNQTLEGFLLKLETARNLCPELGAAWKLSACIATTLGEDDRARYFRDRAVFNGVDDLECAPAGSAALDGQAAATAAASGRSIPTAPPGPVQGKHALIIGVGRFQDSRIRQLEYTSKDAQDLYEALVDPQYGRFNPANVELLVDEAATRARILEGLQRLHERASADDLVVIYVSSHGSASQDGLGLQGVGHIVTHDTQLDKLYVDALPFQDFSEKVATIPARRKVTFLDTCYSGQAFSDGGKTLSIEPLGVAAGTAEMFLSGEGTYVITSSTEAQRSWESTALRNSYFTYYLLDALRASKTPLTIRELFDRLAANVTRAVEQDKGARQEPQFHPVQSAGDLRIGVEPTRGPQHPTSQGGSQ